MDLKLVYAWLMMNRQGLTKTLVIMNLTAILLLATALQVTAAGYGQSVTLNTKDAPLQSVFQQIEKQTGYQFFYKENTVQDKKPVTVQLNDVPLNQALNTILLDQDLSFSIVEKVIVIKQADKKDNFILSPANNLPPPAIDVHGKIVNENGEPVAGATITVKGTNNRVFTDESGEFSLKGINENAILIISAVNIDAREISVNGKSDLSTIAVKIKITEGEAVVIEGNTGYQKVKPNEINGSIVVIDNKKFNEQKGTSVLDRLNGITTAVFFNTGKLGVDGQPRTTNISIRSESSINGPLDPLIVLDNFPYEGDINNINPNDVENITILKDAAATSIYGARGGNGVIVITTKRGRFSQKLQVGLSSNLIISKHSDLFSLPYASINDDINVEQYLFNNGFFDGAITDYSQPSLSPAVEVFLKRRNGLISSSDSMAQINSLKGTDSRDEFTKFVLRNNVTQQYSLQLKGGSQNLAWLIQGNYDKAISELRAVNDKINLRVDNIYKPLKNLEVNIGFYYTSTKSQTGQPGFNEAININSRSVPYSQLANGISKYRSEYLDTIGGGNLLDWRYYPLEDYKHDIITNKREDITANLGIKYQIIKSLGIDIYYQYQRQNSNVERVSDEQSYYTRNLINKFTVLPDFYQVPRGSIKNFFSPKQNSQSFRAQINYSKTWKKHRFSAIAGSEIREVISNQGLIQTVFGYTENPYGYQFLNLSQTYPTLITGNYEEIPGFPLLRPTQTNRFVSVYSNFSYMYNQKYSLSGSLRKDASNTFGLSTNDKWTPLWSLGIGWELNKEKFYPLKAIMPFLKLTTTVGYSGNVDPSRTALVTINYFPPTPPDVNYPAANINTINNPSLRWERSRQVNLRIDFESKKAILVGRVEYYQKKGSDLYGESLYDYTTWGNLPTIFKNAANMKGDGLDIDLRSNNINNIFKWSSNLIFSYTKNKVTNYYSNGNLSQTGASLVTLSGNSISPVIGKPLYAIAAYKWGGLNSIGDPQGFLNGQLSTDYQAISDQKDKDGLLADNVVYIGPSNPTVFGSIINRFEWKRFSASFNIAYRFGYYFRKPSLSYSAFFNSGIGDKEFEKRWQKPGDEFSTNVPAMVYTDYQINGQPIFDLRDQFYQYSEINVLKADNIRLQYINLGYDIQFKKKTTPIRNIQMNLSVSNLGILWRANKYKIDPDYLQKQIPIYSFGLTVNFK